MKKFPKIVQCDKRGQIVIPKDIRSELRIEEGTGFYMYSVTEEGILLKKITPESFEEQNNIIEEISLKADKIGINITNLEKTKLAYKKTKEGNLDLL